MVQDFFHPQCVCCQIEIQKKQSIPYPEKTQKRKIQEFQNPIPTKRCIPFSKIGAESQWKLTHEVVAFFKSLFKSSGHHLHTHLVNFWLAIFLWSVSLNTKSLNMSNNIFCYTTFEHPVIRQLRKGKLSWLRRNKTNKTHWWSFSLVLHVPESSFKNCFHRNMPWCRDMSESLNKFREFVHYGTAGPPHMVHGV